MRRALAGLINKVQESEHRARQERYPARVGRLFLDAPDDMLESFVIGRRNKSGKNLHAAAMARMRAANLRPGQLSELGRRGAQMRLQKRGVIGIGGPTTNLGASRPNEAPGATAPSSG